MPRRGNRRTCDYEGVRLLAGFIFDMLQYKSIHLCVRDVDEMVSSDSNFKSGDQLRPLEL
jgi:hypothetical protein